MSSMLNLGGVVYNPVPPLQHLAVVNVDIFLWSLDDVRNLMEDFLFQLDDFHNDGKWDKFAERWNEIEHLVREKVHLLLLPAQLKKKILNFVKPIGLEIMKWKEFHYSTCDYGTNLPNMLKWTQLGTIDYKKTAELLANNSNLDPLVRFKFASVYCLENYVRELWAIIPVHFKNSCCSHKWMRSFKTVLPVFWSYVMKEMPLRDLFLSLDVSPFQWLFEHAMFYANQAACEYFWQRIDPEERRNSLKRSPINNMDIEFMVSIQHLYGKCNNVAILSLFPLMDEQEQKDTFRRIGCNVLVSLIYWPWQDFFLQVANCFWDVLSPIVFMTVLEAIVRKVMCNYEDYNYRKLFADFWIQSPGTHKRYVIEDYALHFELQETVVMERKDLIRDLFMIEDKENIQLIFEAATLKEQEGIISHYKATKGNKVFQGTGHNLNDSEKNDMRGKLVELLTGLVQEECKKRPMEDEGNSSKRACSVGETSQG